MPASTALETKVVNFRFETNEEVAIVITEMLLDGWKMIGRKEEPGDVVRVYFERGTMPHFHSEDA